jgi:two-component system, OmpR family, response regulator
MSFPPLKKILYAEDEDDIREIAVLAIETIGGFECATCSSGVEVIALAHSFAPQLILLDVMMPIMDGPSTLQALKKDPQLKQIPVVFLTAKIMTEEINHLRTMGAINVIGKPFDPITLSAQIQTIWNHYHE